MAGKSSNKIAVVARRDSSRSHLVKQAILDKAVELFHERGFAETSLQQIAVALELTRGAIYYYYKNKDDILRNLVEDVTFVSTQVPELEQGGGSWRQVLHDHIRGRVGWLIDKRKYFRLLTEVERFLPEDLAQQHLEAKRQLLHTLEHFIREGISGGEFRKVDPTITAFSIIGMVSWTAWWFTDSSRLSADDVAEGMARLCVAMVSDGDAPPDLTLSHLDLIGRIEGDLDSLRRKIQS
jgi:AcrR family transcriptional regulator